MKRVTGFDDPVPPTSRGGTYPVTAQITTETQRKHRDVLRFLTQRRHDATAQSSPPSLKAPSHRDTEKAQSHPPPPIETADHSDRRKSTQDCPQITQIDPDTAYPPFNAEKA